VEWGGGLVEGLAAARLDITITPLPTGPGPGADGGTGEDDEPRVVRLAGYGDRWAATAGSVPLALSGARDAL
jgi:hypothetical protein